MSSPGLCPEEPGAAGLPGLARRGAWPLAARLVLLALVGAAAVAPVAAIVPPRAPAPAAAAPSYRCPMHPEVHAYAPGDCPICRMALVQDSETGAAPRDATPGALATGRLGRVERRAVSDPWRAPAWVDAGGALVAWLYPDDRADLAPADAAVFYPAVSPTRSVAVHLAAAPPHDGDDASAKVRFDPVAPDRALAPGTEGWLAVAPRPRALLLVPSTAILHGSGGPYVVAVDGDRLARRAVRLGRRHPGGVTVLAGLSAGDQVVVVGAFLMDPLDSLDPVAPRGPTRGSLGGPAPRIQNGDRP